MISFACPWMFLLLFLPFLVRFLFAPMKGMHGDALKMPMIEDLEKIGRHGSLPKKGVISSINTSLKALYLIWILLFIAAARPVLSGEPYRPKNFGREIIMVMDISTSMLEPDYAFKNRRISRIDAVKIAAYNFLENRINDKIGLVLFGTRAYLQAPLTFDKESVKKIILDMQPGMAGRSTSIGDALAVAIEALDDENHEAQKVIILLTDGESNDGALSPAQALNLAKQTNVKIYTVGVGNTHSIMDSLFAQMTGVGINHEDKQLKALAEETKGRYYIASDTQSLLKIYEEIDRLEADENEEKYIKNVEDIYYIPLIASILLAMIFLAIRELKK